MTQSGITTSFIPPLSVICDPVLSCILISMSRKMCISISLQVLCSNAVCLIYQQMAAILAELVSLEWREEFSVRKDSLTYPIMGRGCE